MCFFGFGAVGELFKKKTWGVFRVFLLVLRVWADFWMFTRGCKRGF